MIKLYFENKELWLHHLEKDMNKCFFRKHVKHVYAGVKKGKFWYCMSMN